MSRFGWRAAGEASVVIAADPAAVYDRVADVERIGERSTECHRAQWLDGAGPAVGARFRGFNRSGRLARWTRTCEVVQADRSREFAFRTLPERDPSRRDSTTWRYVLEPTADGTRVVHSYAITRPPPAPLRLLFGLLMPQHRDMRPQLRHNLAVLQEQLEAPGHAARTG